MRYGPDGHGLLTESGVRISRPSAFTSMILDHQSRTVLSRNSFGAVRDDP